MNPNYSIPELAYPELARDQRVLTWLTCVLLLMPFVMPLCHRTFAAGGEVILVLFLFWVITFLCAAILLGTIAEQLRFGPMAVLAMAVTAWLPLVGLFPIAYVLINMNRRWKELGLRPGVFGVDAEHVAQLRQWPRCVACGYDLRGNTSGICPECGFRRNMESDHAAQ